MERGGARECVGRPYRNSAGASVSTETASYLDGGSTRNGIEEPFAQRCFPNWTHRVWLWWGWAHSSWCPDAIVVSESSNSRSSDGMIALRATIHTANPVLNRSLMRRLVHHILPR